MIQWGDGSEGRSLLKSAWRAVPVRIPQRCGRRQDAAPRRPVTRAMPAATDGSRLPPVCRRPLQLRRPAGGRSGPAGRRRAPRLWEPTAQRRPRASTANTEGPPPASLRAGRSAALRIPCVLAARRRTVGASACARVRSVGRCSAVSEATRRSAGRSVSPPPSAPPCWLTLRSAAAQVGRKSLAPASRPDASRSGVCHAPCLAPGSVAIRHPPSAVRLRRPQRGSRGECGNAGCWLRAAVARAPLRFRPCSAQETWSQACAGSSLLDPLATGRRLRAL